MNANTGTPQPKPNKRSPAAGAPARRVSGGGCCGGCMTKGSTSVSRPREAKARNGPSGLDSDKRRVEELEMEIQKQKDLRAMYKKRTERTQDYLRHCLQKAQDNGFLDLILNNNNKDDHQNLNLLSPNLTHVTSTPPPPILHHSGLADIVDRARLNGWYIDPTEIELEEKIGQGSTADIYKAKWRGYDVAVKCLFPDFFRSNDSAVSFFAQELDTLSRQRHRFVLHLMGACLEPPDHAWLVTEFLHTTLKEWLHGSGPRRQDRTAPIPPIGERVAMAVEIATGMQYLHEKSPRVIHRDLKPSNIFLDRAMHVRVADFGHARFLTEEEMAFTGETGTYVYMAPEVFRCEPYDEKCDVYSFGIILNELITATHPYIETNYGPAQIAMEVGEGQLRPALPEDTNGQLGDLIDLIRSSWGSDASARPSFAEIKHSLTKIQEIMQELDTRSV